MDKHQVLRRPIVTEKTTFQGEGSRYTFEVDLQATKQEIKEAVEEVFGVRVVAVNAMNLPGKSRRFGRHLRPPSPWRKATVTLAPGQRIEFFEGV